MRRLRSFLLVILSAPLVLAAADFQAFYGLDYQADYLLSTKNFGGKATRVLTKDYDSCLGMTSLRLDGVSRFGLGAEVRLDDLYSPMGRFNDFRLQEAVMFGDPVPGILGLKLGQMESFLPCENRYLLGAGFELFPDYSIPHNFRGAVNAGTDPSFLKPLGSLRVSLDIPSDWYASLVFGLERSRIWDHSESILVRKIFGRAYASLIFNNSILSNGRNQSLRADVFFPRIFTEFFSSCYFDQKTGPYRDALFDAGFSTSYAAMQYSLFLNSAVSLDSTPQAHVSWGWVGRRLFWRVFSASVTGRHQFMERSLRHSVLATAGLSPWSFLTFKFGAEPGYQKIIGANSGMFSEFSAGVEAGIADRIWITGAFFWLVEYGIEGAMRYQIGTLGRF
jgi:hypothetical protein